jgi:hypothetical protein
MQRKLLASVAAAPILAMAFAASAEVTITTTVTTPVSTAAASSAGADNIRITSSGSVAPTTAGAAVTINSNNTVTNEGNISLNNLNDSVGVLILGGYTGGFTSSAAISVSEDYLPTDADGDGDLDGELAQGKNRYGIRIVGPGAFTGDITTAGGSTSVRGDDSAGISIETLMVGSLKSGGGVVVGGKRAYGIHTTADITGSFTVLQSVQVSGQDSVGIGIDGNIGGRMTLQSNVTTYGYRYIERPFLDTDTAKLDADDLYLSGSALRIAGNVGGGVLLDIPPLDLIADDGKSDTTTDSDEDGDGIQDNVEPSSALLVYGSAPVVKIGSDTRSVTLGAVGSGDLNYGFVNRGGITALGVYDGVSATGMQIGGSTGQSTVIANGLYNSGTISAQAAKAGALGVHLTAGARVDTFQNEGGLASSATSETTDKVRGLLIDQGASMTTVNVGVYGQINATLEGEKGTAVAIDDQSGTLRNINNSGKIIASIAPTDDVNDKDDADTDPTNEVVTGSAAAIDARANTTGVTYRQTGVTDGDDFKDGVADADADGDGVDDNDEPILFGDILLGSGDDLVDIQNGTTRGAIAFGAGNNTLAISGGASVIGSISDVGGTLAVNIGKGTLSVTNPSDLTLRSLDMASNSQLLVIADPLAGTSTKLVVQGTANIATGAQIGMTLKSVLDAPTRYTIIEAATLNAGVLNQNVIASSPYLYIASATADQAAGKVYVDIRARTTAELGFSKSQASSYDAVLKAIQGDSLIQTAMLGQTTRGGLVSLYDQLTPDTGEGTFAALETANQLMSQATANRPDPYDRYGPDSFWAQEINTLVRRENSDTQGSDSQVFGFMGGYESMSANGGALGLTLAYVNVEEHDSAAVVGENTTASVFQGGVYYRKSMGGLQLNAGAGGGYAWFDGKRRFIAGDADGDGNSDVIRSNSAQWNGATANAFAGIAYQAMVGRFYARPELRLDYLYLSEGERKESGGGKALDLTIQDRSGSNLSGEAAITFGANFGRDVWVRPEVRIGYRQALAGELGDTVAQFSGGTPFTVASAGKDDGALTLNLALKSGTAMSYLGVEAGAEARKKQKRYNVRLIGRAMF